LAVWNVLPNLGSIPSLILRPGKGGRGGYCRVLSAYGMESGVWGLEW
jgi:hypothetical protein